MANKLQKRILYTCRLALFIALMTTIGLICAYRHYQQRLVDRSILYDYIELIHDSKADLDLKRLNRNYKVCFSAQIDGDGNVHMLHNGVSGDYSEAYLQHIVREVSAQKERNGVLTGFLFLKVNEASEELIACYDLQNSIHVVLRSFIYAFVFGLMLILFANIMITVWVKQTIAPVIQAGQAQIQFFSDVGHELKTPLAIISANTEVLELTTGENLWTKTILKQVERMTDLVQNMLMLTRLESPQLHAEVTEYPLGVRMTQELEAFQVMAEMKEITYETDIDRSVSVCGNAALLDQMVIELLNNAIKYTPEKGTISAKLKERNHQVVLKLWNTHDPLPKEELEKIFQRFYRVETSRCQEISGFGIGLSAVKSIVERYDGSIRANYHDGGICFEIHLPGSGEN